MSNKLTIIINGIPEGNPFNHTFMGCKVETIIRGDASDTLEYIREANEVLMEEIAGLKELIGLD
jgi:hypothetical protein